MSVTPARTHPSTHRYNAHPGASRARRAATIVPWTASESAHWAIMVPHSLPIILKSSKRTSPNPENMLDGLICTKSPPINAFVAREDNTSGEQLLRLQAKTTLNSAPELCIGFFDGLTVGLRDRLRPLMKRAGQSWLSLFKWT